MYLLLGGMWEANRYQIWSNTDYWESDQQVHEESSCNTQSELQ